MPEMSACGGYYHHRLVRTADGWRSRNLREENLWFTNPVSDTSSVRTDRDPSRKRDLRAHSVRDQPSAAN
jgi:hypothetical protein